MIIPPIFIAYLSNLVPGARLCEIAGGEIDCNS